MSSKHESKDTLSLVFQALADPTRRKMLEQLQKGDCSLGQLAEPFQMTLPAVLKHLKVLSNAGLIEHHKEGRVRHCRLEEGPIVDATVWLSKQSKYWQAQFELLATFLSTTENEKLGDKHELRIQERTTEKTSKTNKHTKNGNDRTKKGPRTRKGN